MKTDPGGKNYHRHDPGIYQILIQAGNIFYSAKYSFSIPVICSRFCILVVAFTISPFL